MQKSYFVLLGGPGSGKGTQAELASKEFGLGHLSTGEKFRTLWKSTQLTPLEKEIKEHVEAGGYVPDNMTNELTLQWLHAPEYVNGAFLDGYPRTLPQVFAFEDMLLKLNGALKAAFFFNVNKEALIIRITKRVTCASCGATFNTVTNPSKIPGICDIDGGVLEARADQEGAAVTERFDMYFEKTQPIIDYYKKKHLLIEINGESSITDVYSDFAMALHRFIKSKN